jgi:hypothetical protein
MWNWPFGGAMFSGTTSPTSPAINAKLITLSGRDSM